MKLNLNVRGMRDFYPELNTKLNHIFKVWRETAISYGYEEYEGPMIETLDLYKLKSGEDIVKQLYNFTDKGGRELALRPEMTPTLARMVSKVYNEVQKPIKWFSIPRCLRYEKPQKGRLREFYQLNIDIIGEESELADAEVIAVAIDSLINLGLNENDFVVKINNRDFVSSFFGKFNIDEEVTFRIYKIIDNARKVPKDVTEASINELKLNDTQKKAVYDYLSIRSLDDEIFKSEKSDGALSLVNLFSILGKMELGTYCEFDPSIVRGLDYYTGSVFEIYDRSERMRAICGGGRYNRLLQEFLGVQVPGCGFGMGDVVLGEILESKGLLPEYKKKVDYYLVRITDDELELMLKVARSLRKRGFIVDYSYKLSPVKKQMARASRLNAEYAVIFGPDEVKTGKVKVKNLETGEEKVENIDSYYDI